LEVRARRIKLQRSTRDQFRLIEPALTPLCLEERHRDNRNAPGVEQAGFFKRRLECSDGLGEHASEHIGRRTHAVELQQVNQLAQSAVITAVGYGTAKRTFDAAAYRASPKTIIVYLRVRGKHPLPADRAHAAANWMNNGEAIKTDWKPGNI
jgi:hypothetical protein